MPVVNLAEDFKRRFSLRSDPVESKTQPPPSEPVSDSPIDIVSSTPANTPEKVSTNITSDVWQTNLEASSGIPSDPVNNIKNPSRRIIQAPVIIGNKQFRSSGTANWAQIRKSVYPIYKQYCLDNGTIPSIHEFTSLIGPRWKALSPEDKAKACADPSSYFTF